MSTIPYRIIELVCLLVRFTQVSSHGTEVRYCKTNSQKLRIFVAHWHEGEVDQPSDAGKMNIRNDNTNEVYELTPDGVINNHDKTNLTDVGDCQGVETFLATTCPTINDDDDWAYFDFNVSCENPPQYSLLAGNTIILTEGCADLYPASISLSTACEVSNSPSLSSSPSVTSPTKSPSPSTSFPSNRPSLKPSSRPTRDPSPMPVQNPISNPSSSPSFSPSIRPSISPSIEDPVGDTGNCKDSGCVFVRKSDLDSNIGIISTKRCSWVSRKNTDKRCRYKYVKSHCPNACGACTKYKCSNSLAKFYLWEKERRTCPWIAALNDEKKEKYCRFKVAANNCPVTCGTCKMSDENCTDIKEKFPLMAKRRSCQHVVNNPKLCRRNGVAATCRLTCSYSNPELGLQC